ncbi:DUF6783 domain-containing protein [Faecalicatena faecalis]
MTRCDAHLAESNFQTRSKTHENSNHFREEYGAWLADRFIIQMDSRI